jgi:predicted DNA-binding transcriptional regulator AlpA
MSSAPEDLAVPREVASHLDTSVDVLAYWRHMGRGPAFVKLGRRVYYRWSDVNAWIAANVQTITRPAV